MVYNSRTLPLVVLLFLLASSAAAAAPEASPADAWPLARGTPGGTGVAGSALAEKLTLAWTFTPENKGSDKQGFQAGAAIAGGAVYVGSTAGMLYSVDLATGRKNWEYDSKSDFKTTPAVRDGRVYIGDQDGVFHCVEAATGKRLWKFACEDKIDSPAAFYRDRVLFGSEDSNVYCLDAAGNVVWKCDLEDQVRCPATVSGNRGYFAACSANLYVVDLDKGTTLAKIPIDGPTGCAAALYKDRATWATRTTNSWQSIW